MSKEGQDLKLWPFTSSPRLTLGTIFPLLPLPTLTLKPSQVATHKHIIGVSGSGKSKLLESIFLQLLRQRVGVTMLDPHADSAEAILATLSATGFFRRPDAFKRLLYIEFQDEDFFLPFNVLRQPGVSPHTIASNVLEAMHRAWPELSSAAPAFDNMVKRGVRVLLANDLPLPALERLLTDPSYRGQLLQQVTDYGVLTYWQNFIGEMSKPDQFEEAKSTLRRLSLLIDSPLLEHSLGAQENLLDFRRIIDEGTAVLFNLGHVSDTEARRLLGCLITIGYETASLSRTDIPHDQRRAHHLLLDEFSDYSAQSEEALSRTLSLTRKFGLFATMAHQTWSQASQRLQGALQNVGVRVAMKVGREDAEVLARQVGAVDPDRIKHEVQDQDALERTHPAFYSLPEQWEGWVQTLTELKPRQAIVKVAGRRASRIKTLLVPTPNVRYEILEAFKNEYRRRFMRRKEDITLVYQQRLEHHTIRSK